MSDITNSKITARILHWYKVDVKAYEIIYGEAKEKFEDIMQESESITNKAFKMIAALAAFSGFIIGFLTSMNFTGEKAIIATILSILIVINLFLLYFLVVPKGVIQRGIAPEHSITQNFDDPDDKGYQVQLAYHTILTVLQNNIDVMRTKNKERIKIYKWSMNLSLIIILFTAYIATTILIHL